MPGLLKYDRLPRKYQLFWDSNRRAISIQVHKDCMRTALVVPPNSPWLKSMREEHRADGLFDFFEGDLRQDNFGFNRLIKKDKEFGDYVEFNVPLPIIEKETGISCQECGGTGKRLDFDKDKCLWCRGKKRDRVFEWQDAYLTTASLGLILDILDLCDETTSKDQQHIRLTMLSKHGQHGSSLGGYFGIDFSQYLRENTTELQLIVLKDAVEAMEIAYGHMMTLSSDYHHSIRGEIDRGFLTLDCPGDACGIHLSDHESNGETGREFSCHNVDSPAQSLTLLAGIASLLGQADFFMSSRAEQAVASDT